MPVKILAGMAVVLLLSACGSGGSGTTAPPPIQMRGIKGESATEKATNQTISPADCAVLGRVGARLAGTPLARHLTPGPPLSRCRLEGHRTSINVYLDSGFAAHQRFKNRIVEIDQFGYEDPAKSPHPVPRVGEKAAYESGAYWVPGLGSLFAVRGNRWLTVAIAAAGRSDPELRRMASTLARAGFGLTAET